MDGMARLMIGDRWSELANRTTAILQALIGLVDDQDIEWVVTLIDNREYGEAVDVLAALAIASRARVSRDTFRELLELADDMGLTDDFPREDVSRMLDEPSL
jgi:hypothetical protein